MSTGAACSETAECVNRTSDLCQEGKFSNFIFNQDSELFADPDNVVPHVAAGDENTH